MVVEFREASWLTERERGSAKPLKMENAKVKESTMKWLEENGMIFVTVDEFIEPNDGTDGDDDKPSFSSSQVSSSSLLFASQLSPAKRRTAQHTKLKDDEEEQEGPNKEEGRNGSSFDNGPPKAQHQMNNNNHNHNRLQPSFVSSSVLYKQLMDSNGGIEKKEEEEEEKKMLIENKIMRSKRQIDRGTVQQQVPKRPKQADKAEEEGEEERERLVPIICQLTSADFAYVRIHRRRGWNRLLTETELDEWSDRLQQMLRSMNHNQTTTTTTKTKNSSEVSEAEQSSRSSSVKRLFLLWNSNFEDQSMINAAGLAKRLGDKGLSLSPFLELYF